MDNRLNKYKYPGAKRLMLEAQELKDPTEDYYAQPVEDNLFEWHFTLRGPPDTPFDCGYYHGRLSFPTEYPMKPPSIIVLTPNGRFETNKKICLSISGYHPETWQPSWSVRTALIALIAFMQTKGNRAIGSLDYSDAERRKLAIKSQSWCCETCGSIKDLLKSPEQSPGSEEDKASTEQKPSCSSRVQNVVDNCNDNKSSDKERDSSFDSRESESEQTTHETTSHPDTADSVDNIVNTNELENSQAHRPWQTQLETAAENLDRRRAYSSLVFKSIFILLSLLILRRVVMVMSAS